MAYVCHAAAVLSIDLVLFCFFSSWIVGIGIVNGSAIAETAAEIGTKNGNAVVADHGSAGDGHAAERRMNGNAAGNAAKTKTKIKTGSASDVVVPGTASGIENVTETRKRRCQKRVMPSLMKLLLERWV